MTKDARVLNMSATKFEVPSHVSERDERSEARAEWEVSQGVVPFEDGLDTTLDCVELTKETIQ